MSDRRNETMKKFFFFILLVALLLSASFIGFGIYVNKTSDSYIETMMASRAVSLNGMRALYREITPEIVLDSITLQTEKVTDAIAQIDGTISAIYVTQGQKVQVDQKLCLVSNADIALQISRADTDIARAHAAYLNSKSSYERNLRLSEKNAISKSELETSNAQMDAAAAELEAAKIARNQLTEQSGRQTVTAPVAGSVIMIYQQAGAYVTRGAPLIMIGDFGRMVFRGLIQDEKIRNIAPLGESFKLIIDTSDLTDKALNTEFTIGFGEDTSMDVKIRRITPDMMESAPVRNVTWEVDNKFAILEPGLYSDMIIRKTTSRKAICVPLALITNSSVPALYVADEDSRLSVRKIKAGIYDSDFIEITEGLNEGDVVITSGVDGLELGAKIDVNVEEYVNEEGNF
jgi:RND family efflux transporter MFP subunit